MTSKPSILVLGATGQQGGATARHLLARGWSVRAFTRDPSSVASQALALLGAEVVAGDMGDGVSLEEAMHDAHGVFSVQPPSWVPTLETDANEVRLGILVADTARRIGVQHFVYTSVSGADQQESFRVAYKGSIERHIWDIGLPATVIRPSAFMENYLGVRSGVLLEPRAPDLPVNLIAADDIGTFAAIIFDHPGDFIGKTINLAGDSLTPPQIADALTRALGTPIHYRQVADTELRQRSELLAEVFAWFNRGGYPATDIAALRAWHPGLLTFEAWLAREGAARIKAQGG